ncbi:MAG: hypothetical protein ACC669_02065 [bacterium]
MKFLTDAELRKILRFAPDLGVQTTDGRLIFTLMKIEQILGEGKIAVSSSESEDARRVKRPVRGSTGEGNNAWWDLGQGSYLITYNETVDVPEGGSLVIQPHASAMKNGLWHPTLFVRDWARDMEAVLMVVSVRGLRIQENSPVSVGYVMAPAPHKP